MIHTGLVSIQNYIFAFDMRDISCTIFWLKLYISHKVIFYFVTSGRN